MSAGRREARLGRAWAGQGAIGALALALAALLAGALLPALAAGSDGNVVTGLHDVDGLWHSFPEVRVGWDPNPPGSGSEIILVVRGPLGEALPGMVPVASEGLTEKVLSVPASPAPYVVEAIERHADGSFGPPTWVQAYFDDLRPAPIAVDAPAWVAAGTAVRVHVGHPLRMPISGFGGYALSVDDAPMGTPCARPDRCTSAELDLHGGVAADSVDLPAPPEGVSYVHASVVSRSGMASPPSTTPIGVDGTPPQVRIEGAPSGWADGPVRLTARAADHLSGMAVAGPGGPATAIEVDGGAPLVTPGDRATATVAGEGFHRVVYWGRDAVGNTGDGSLPFAQPGTATIAIDETDPRVHFAAGDPGDPERIEAIVADALAGPATDRGEIELRPAGSSGRFQPLPTDVKRGKLVARWSSDDYPHGPYEFRAVGYDSAGNSTASSAGPDGAALVLHNPVKREARLAFGFGAGKLVFQRCTRADGARRCHRAVVRSFARRPASRAVPCCHGTLVGGRLVDAAGEPFAGQTVDVVEAFARGARTPGRTTTVTTDARGEFHAWLEPGPSRRVSAEFPGTHRLTRATGRGLRLRVRAAVHLRVSTTRVRVGGPPVVFSGRIVHPEARIPATGLPVELEFRLPGTAWAEFRTLQTDASGRFSYPYSFSDDDSNGVRFLFRAFVPATGDWAFAPATSRPLAVTG